MQALGGNEEKISCISNNLEKYMTFSVGQLQFIDSLQFLNSSLDKLSANLRLKDPQINFTVEERTWSYYIENVSLRIH